jgi:hypothetical protein
MNKVLTSYAHCLEASLGFKEAVFWKSKATLP